MKDTLSKTMHQELSSGKPLVRKDLSAQGLRVNSLSEMVARGSLYRVARGVYAPSSGSTSPWFDYELAAKVVPKGVFTLASALRIYGLTNENPQRMTMAIPVKDHPPKTTLPIDFSYMKPELLASDVVTLNTERVPFRVFSVERTIAECFKARNRIGVGVAVAALREAVEKSLVNFATLGDILKRCRMLRVAAPYLEGLV